MQPRLWSLIAGCSPSAAIRARLAIQEKSGPTDGPTWMGAAAPINDTTGHGMSVTAQNMDSF